jgi:hypothetical protein
MRGSVIFSLYVIPAKAGIPLLSLADRDRVNRGANAAVVQEKEAGFPLSRE